MMVDVLGRHFRYCPETGLGELSTFSSYASICGDIFISWSPRFSFYGDRVNLLSIE